MDGGRETALQVGKLGAHDRPAIACTLAVRGHAHRLALIALAGGSVTQIDAVRGSRRAADLLKESDSILRGCPPIPVGKLADVHTD